MKQQSWWSKNWKLVVNILTFVALGLFVWAIRDDLVETLRKLHEVNFWVLLLLIPIQILNYDAQVRIYQGVFKIEKTAITYKNLFRATLELNFVNNVFPSGGVVGVSFFGIRLKQYGVSIAKATAAHMMKLIMFFLSFELMIVLAVVALAIGGHINNLVLLLAGSLVTTLVILTIGVGVVIGSKKRITSFINFMSNLIGSVLRLFRRQKKQSNRASRVKALFEDMHDHYLLFSKDWRKLVGPLFWGFMANFWEIMTIYVVYVAFGEWVNIGAVILAYAVANSAGFVSILPGGVGIYEALMTFTLSITGVPSRLSLPVTIMYRVLSTIVQVPVGYFAYTAYINSLKPSEQEKIEALVENAGEENTAHDNR